MPKKRSLILLTILLMLATPNLFSLSFAYDEDLSTVSDVTLGLTALAPSLFVLSAPPSDYLAIGTSYAGTMVVAYATRSVLKHTIERARPYVGEIDRPADTSEDYESFPSGHALMAFSAAAYTQTLQALWYPDSKAMKAVSYATWGLAATTATLRVLSGNHHLGDVLAGAAIGSAIGFLGPYLTNRLLAHDEHAPQILIGPTVGMQVSL
ncbi:MAG: phosphatase PAP2 family protein [Sphaerochaeta sp.]|nr:phosphatase PAP2 family protein [Sphaerochaeta sp.]